MNEKTLNLPEIKSSIENKDSIVAQNDLIQSPTRVKAKICTVLTLLA